MNYRTSFGNRVAAEVRAEMARKRFSQVRLSKETGIPESTLKRRLSGQYPFDVEELVDIARALGVSPHSFIPKKMTA